ncbi:MAG: GntR family transcriptional regulator [Oxalicibacterium faecigallinarum]|uniref:GntR family transcriptional regulator n=1 Tax=Oxalicibacterium faecigallinarum TaxID=573741 RepID=UPI002806D775|nr:GntR family transcriptional regulator [Oxalicibacterium faecigallinarum]MDQ7970391.1 GntR family transcriptional regulator [Oxalicibacterium faecigallinarum]
MATTKKPVKKTTTKTTTGKTVAVKKTKSVASTELHRIAGPKPKLTDLAYDQLEEAIITLKIPPGSVISELTLSEMLNIGRTPIREAIQRLAREHLLLVLPQRGLLVPEIDLKKQLKLLETRREVERLICKSAARRATPDERKIFARLFDEFMHASKTNDDVVFMRSDREFNELTLVAARNEFAEGAMRLMHGLSRRFWYFHYKQAADLPEMARLHANVAGAIAKGDVEAAGLGLDLLLDNIETFAKATLMADM